MRFGVYDVWHKPCKNCGYDHGRWKRNTCWRCDRKLERDFSERALKKARG